VFAVLVSVEGVYRDGKVDLSEAPAGIAEARVIVTFLPTASPVERGTQARDHIDLETRDISVAQAASLRARLAAFAEDWDLEAMDAYDAL
jgi:hypothetical protein